MADLYDLIFLGVNEDADRAESISGISAMLGVDAKEIEYLLKNKLSSPLKQAISLDAARQYQSQIAQLGGVCNYRPSRWDGRTLELAPVEIRAEEFIFSCPACEHKQSVAAEEDLPSACPACGVIPSKYEKVSGYKQSRGIGTKASPRNPLPTQDLPGQPATDVRQSLQYPQSPQSIMEKAWPEPALPKKLAESPALRLGAGALLWMLGAIMGGVAVSAYYELKPRAHEQAPPPMAESPADTATPQAEPQPEAATPEAQPPEPAPENKP